MDIACNESFEVAIGSVLVFAQFFGVMPVIGVKSNCASELHFKWNSRRTIYSIIVFVLLASYTGLTVISSFKYGFRYDEMGINDKRPNTIFY